MRVPIMTYPKEIKFANSDLEMNKTEFLQHHSNGMQFTAYDSQGKVLYITGTCLLQLIYSVGDSVSVLLFDWRRFHCKRRGLLQATYLRERDALDTIPVRYSTETTIERSSDIAQIPYIGGIARIV